MGALSFRQVARRMDPIEPPTRMRGVDRPEPDLGWYLTNAGTDVEAMQTAMRRTTDDDVGLYSDGAAGLSHLHRWTSHQRSAKAHLSLRSMLSRHADESGSVCRLLFYNTWLIDTPLDIRGPDLLDERQRELGEALSQDEHDIVALCEVFSAERGRAINRALRYPFETRRGPEDSGLHAIINRSRCRIADTRRKAFHNDGSGIHDIESFKSKGLLYLEVDLGPGSIDLFLTHMHATSADVRRRQLMEVMDFIDTHAKRSNVTVLTGDLNIDGRSDEYTHLLNQLYGPGRIFRPIDADLQSDHTLNLKLRDEWLVRGSRLGATHTIDDMDSICALDPTDARFCDDTSTTGIPANSSDRSPGFRLDYLFVEHPHPAHSFNLDITRIRRRPFWRGLQGHADLPASRFAIDDVPNFLSDHLGLQVTFIASPK